MLKPTVGIELFQRQSESQKPRTRRQCPHSLNRELSTLKEPVSYAGQGNPGISRLTASTRNRDVFPAFCSPTRVISISVALLDVSLVTGRGIYSRASEVGWELHDCAQRSVEGREESGAICYSPEGSEQELIQLAESVKYSRHRCSVCRALASLDLLLCSFLCAR